MVEAELERLKHRRQYILSPRPIDCPFMHTMIQVTDRFRLYTHIDLPIAKHSLGEVELILLGNIFDYRNTHLDNPGILAELIETDLDLLLEKIAYYAGRFVLLFIRKESFTVLHDAGAARKIYYGKNNEGFWFASQPYLLAELAEMSRSKDPSKLSFYVSAEFHTLNNSNIGDTTLFDDIHQLLPNHYLDMKELKPVRFWPNKTIEIRPPEEVAEICSKMLSGYVESMGYRHKVMIPVTGGKDSRTIFSASRHISDKAFYYVNKEHFLDPNSNDIRIPQDLLTRLNLKFNILDPYAHPVDKEFEKVYRQNMGYPLDNFLPHIYNYYMNFNDRVNLPGIFVGSAYEMYGTYNKEITPEILARFNSLEKYPHAIAYYQKWLAESEAVCRKCNINIFVLFYWEERLANWGTNIQLYKDIAQEDFMPYNSRAFNEAFFSAHPKYNDRPNYVLYKKIIGKLWPEALHAPINPGFKHSIIALLHFLGILNLVRRVRFNWIYKR
jgi:hypothetical protein